MDGCGPVVRSIAVHKRGQVADGKGDIWAGPNSNVDEHTDQRTVRHASLPVQDFGRDRDSLVGLMESESGNHGSVAQVSIAEVEAIHNLVNEGCLG